MRAGAAARCAGTAAERGAGAAMARGADTTARSAGAAMTWDLWRRELVKWALAAAATSEGSARAMSAGESAVGMPPAPRYRGTESRTPKAIQKISNKDT